MHYILLIFLLALFILAGIHVLNFGKKHTIFFLIVALSAIVICTLVLFSYCHIKLDALVVILLLIATAALGIFFINRKL